METVSAPVWKRMLAFILDLYLGLVTTVAFLRVLQQELPHNIGDVITGAFVLSPLGMTLVIYTSIFLLLYHVFCEYIIGQTPGMLLFGLRVEQTRPKAVVGKQKDAPEGTGIGFWQALGRNLFILPFMPFFLFWLIEPLYYVFQGERVLEHWTHTATVG